MPDFRQVLRIAFPAYVALVAFLSLTPSGPSFEAGQDKWAHYGAYFVMAVLGLPLPRTQAARRGMFVFVMTAGAVLEWLQGFAPVRFPDPWDALANVAGAAMGSVVWWTAAGLVNRVRERDVR
jgi:VanZ family protein